MNQHMTQSNVIMIFLFPNQAIHIISMVLNWYIDFFWTQTIEHQVQGLMCIFLHKYYSIQYIIALSLINRLLWILKTSIAIKLATCISMCPK